MTAILSPYPPKKLPLAQLEHLIAATLDDRKAENIVSIDLIGKADFADRMIVASGTSARHVAALAEHVVHALKEAGFDHVPVEGKDACDWVLVDAGDVVVHLFRPEVREYYHIEKMWSVNMPPAAKTRQPEAIV